jgi:hypothetical protein
MSTVFSAGYTRGCYYEVFKEHEGAIRVTVETPINKRELVCTSYTAAQKWVDTELTKYEKLLGYDD